MFVVISYRKLSADPSDLFTRSRKSWTSSADSLACTNILGVELLFIVTSYRERRISSANSLARNNIGFLFVLISYRQR